MAALDLKSNKALDLKSNNSTNLWEQIDDSMRRINNFLYRNQDLDDIYAKQILKIISNLMFECDKCRIYYIEDENLKITIINALYEKLKTMKSFGKIKEEKSSYIHAICKMMRGRSRRRRTRTRGRSRSRRTRTRGGRMIESKNSQGGGGIQSGIIGILLSLLLLVSYQTEVLTFRGGFDLAAMTGRSELTKKIRNQEKKIEEQSQKLQLTEQARTGEFLRGYQEGQKESLSTAIINVENYLKGMDKFVTRTPIMYDLMRALDKAAITIADGKQMAEKWAEFLDTEFSKITDKEALDYSLSCLKDLAEWCVNNPYSALGWPSSCSHAKDITSMSDEIIRNHLLRGEPTYIERMSQYKDPVVRNQIAKEYMDQITNRFVIQNPEIELQSKNTQAQIPENYKPRAIEQGTSTDIVPTGGKNKSNRTKRVKRRLRITKKNKRKN